MNEYLFHNHNHFHINSVDRAFMCNKTEKKRMIIGIIKEARGLLLTE